MTWNLRLVEMTDPEFPDDPYIEIREVFYDQMGKPLGHSAATMGGADKEEIKQYLKWGMEALDKSILHFGE